MSTKEANAIIGKYGTIFLDGLTVKIYIDDVRIRFGQIDYLVVPVEGSGTKWVTEGRVKLV